jgi:hypothetical protein
MVKLLIGGFVLVVLGLGGAVSACQAGPDDRDLWMAAVSGLAVAAGLAAIGLGAVRRGYHYKPPGEPPADMDADKASEPTPKEPPRPILTDPRDGANPENR